jgi:hypothetical protein
VSSKEKKDKRGRTQGLQFGLDQVHIVTPTRNKTDFTHVNNNQNTLNEKSNRAMTMKLADNWWKDD